MFIVVFVSKSLENVGVFSSQGFGLIHKLNTLIFG